jgi:hypothetical protein
MTIDTHFTTYRQPPFANSLHWDALQNTASPLSSTGDEGTDLPIQVLDRLEQLDDVIFAAIDGDPEALDAAAATWQCTLNELGWDTVEESRQQYLRCAKSAWEAARQNPEDRDPLAAIEIIGLLVNVEW